MTTYEDINAIIDGIVARMETNIVSLGGTSGQKVIEGDETPAAIRSFPSFYCLPLIDGGDQITTVMSFGPRDHFFKVILAGAYKSIGIAALLRTTRNYGYVCADLFSLSYQAVSGIYYDEEGVVDTSRSIKGYCTKPKVNVSYHQLGSSGFVHTWSVEIFITTKTM